MPIRTLVQRVHRLVNRRAFERELDDELRFHVEMQTQRNIELGLSPDEARRRAEREFGRSARYKDEVRDARGLTWMDNLQRDVRLALRSLRRAPAFAATAVLCLALGVGANAAIFSVVNAVLLRPLPFAAPDELVRIYETRQESPGFSGSVSLPNFRDWQEQTASFVGMAAYTARSRILHGVAEPERVLTVTGSPNAIDVLGGRPLLGRTFRSDEGATDDVRVALVSEGLWRRRFDADPDVVGRSITLDGTPYTVAGVMPASFDFFGNGSSVDAWLPLDGTGAGDDNRGSHSHTVIARLRPGVPLAQANAELRQIAARLEVQYPADQAGRSAEARSLRETIVGDVRPALFVLLGAVGLVLLIACANVANLLLARAATRRHEVGIRLALGATRARLMRQLLVESMLLALAGAAAGGALAWAALRSMSALLASALPTGGTIPLDGRVFLFLLAVAAVSGLLFGVGPAMQSSRTSVRTSLAGAGAKATAGGGQRRVRSALVIAEIALSLMLLVGAGLLMRGFLMLRDTDAGLEPANVVTAHIALPSGRYPSDEITPRLLRPILETVRAIPGVEDAAAVSLLPLQSAWTNGSFTIVGRPAPQPGQEPQAELRAASPRFFASLGIPVRAGRDFVEHETTPVVIINEALARRHFPNESPLGRQLGNLGSEPMTIVGVVGDVRQAGLDQAPLQEIYGPYNADGVMGWIPSMTLVVKTTVDPTSVVPALRRAVRAVDATQPVYRVMTMNEVIDESLAGRRLNLWLLGGFAAVALVLAAAGLYGVVAYLVTQRTREIGIRMALGAQRRDVVRLVLRHGAALTVAGITLGLLGALLFTRLLDSLVYGVSTRDPFTFTVLSVLLAAVALLATYIPARRATRVDPVLAIRSE